MRFFRKILTAILIINLAVPAMAAEKIMTMDLSTGQQKAKIGFGTAGQLLTSNGTGSVPTFQDAPAAMVYPGAGIPQSTGSAWGTSLTFSTDGTFADNSDTKIPSQKAVKTYADTKATKGANSDITSLSGLTTALSVAQGGTGQTTQQAAIDALTNVSAATNEYVLTKDTATGNAIFKAASGGANTTLSNLGTVAINTTIASDTDNTDDLGTSAIRWANAQIVGMGRKNLIINGSGIINQRVSAYTLVKNTYGFGPDRFAGMATGTAVSAGTLTQTTSANCGHTGYGFKFSGVTLTGTGILYLRTRIEAKDALWLKNQYASFQAKVYHDVGSSVNYTIYVRKANSADNFAAVTDISNSGATAVATATATTIKYENIAMGDCSTGIEIEIKVECGAVTTKNFEFTEMQLELGSKATEIEYRNTKAELELCAYYCIVLTRGTYGLLGLGYSISTTQADTTVSFPTRMRANPTVENLSALVLTITDRVNYTLESTSVATQEISNTALCFRVTISTGGMTQYRTCYVLASSSGGSLVFSAEL